MSPDQDTWASNVISHIRASLKDVKKGWFNLEETSDEVYGFSKLKKFLMFLNFNMEDAMRTLIKKSLTEFTQHMVEACATTVSVMAVNDVAVSAGLAGSGQLPLFQVDLVSVGQGASAVFDYSTPIESFLDTPLSFFDQAIRLTQNITQIERKVMVKLFWSDNPKMASVQSALDQRSNPDGDQDIADLRDTIKQSLTAAIDPVKEYLTTYEPYVEFLRLDVAEFMAEIEDKYAKTNEVCARPHAGALPPH